MDSKSLYTVVDTVYERVKYQQLYSHANVEFLYV